MAAGESTTADYTFGQIAIGQNICSIDQIKEALDIQNKLRTIGVEPKKLGDILVEKGYLSPQQANEVARQQIIQLAGTRVQIPGYELLSKIGQGAMGAVYKARQMSMDRVVAVKILGKQWSKDANFVQRFLREARAVAALSHENIITGIDVGVANDLHYFVMEFVEGKTASITGSIIGNILFVLGLSAFLGGLRRKEQTFSATAAASGWACSSLRLWRSPFRPSSPTSPRRSPRTRSWR